MLCTQLIPFLESIATVPDVRPLVRDHFKLHERVQAAGPADGANDPESADQDAEAATTSCQE